MAVLRTAIVSRMAQVFNAAGDNPSIVVQSLSILNVVLDHQLEQVPLLSSPACSLNRLQFVTNNLDSLLEAMMPTINSEHPKIVSGVSALLAKMLKRYPLDDPTIPPPVVKFYTAVQDVAKKSIQHFNECVPTALCCF